MSSTKIKIRNGKSFLETIFTMRSQKKMKSDPLDRENFRMNLVANNLAKTLNELEFQKKKLIDFTNLNDYSNKIRDAESRVHNQQTENGLLKIQINETRTKHEQITLESNSEFNQLEGLENQKQEQKDQQQQQQDRQEHEKQQKQLKKKNKEEEEKDKILKKIQENQKQIKIYEKKEQIFRQKLDDLEKTKLQEEELMKQYFKTKKGKQLIIDQNQNIEDLKQVLIKINKRIKKISFELGHMKNSTATFFGELTRQNLIQIKIERLNNENIKIRQEISQVLDGFDCSEYFQVSAELENKDFLTDNGVVNSNSDNLKEEKETEKETEEETEKEKDQEEKKIEQNKFKISNLKKKNLKSSHSLDEIKMSSCENFEKLNSEKNFTNNGNQKNNLMKHNVGLYGSTESLDKRKTVDLKKLFSEYGKLPYQKLHNNDKKTSFTKMKTIENNQNKMKQINSKKNLMYFRSKSDNHQIQNLQTQQLQKIKKIKSNSVDYTRLKRIQKNHNQLHSNQFGVSTKTLDNLLSIPVAFDYFKEFLCKQFNQENIMFFQDVKDYKTQARSYKRIKKKAKNIYLKYIKEGSLFEINIIFSLRKKIIDQISKKQFSLKMFDEAQETVYGHLYRNSLGSFMKSDIYKNLTEKLQKDSKFNLYTNTKKCYLISNNLKKHLNKKTEPKALNEENLFDGKQQQADELCEKLLVMLLDIIQSNYNFRKEEIKVKQILKSIQFSRFLELSSQLQKVTFKCLKNEDDKLRFWLNLYNTLVLHSFIVNGFPKDKAHYEKLLKQSKYLVNQQYFSLNDIYHGILRCNSDPKNNNRNYFKSESDGLKDLMLQKIDLRIHFLCYNYSLPSFITAYHKTNFQSSLEKITKKVLQPLVKINHNQNKILLPYIFNTYENDFQCNQNILDWINLQLNISTEMNKNPYTIKYSNKNNSTQQFTFDHKATLLRKFMN
ncbi:electron carrier/ protein disulfide oxidoreductase [Anaeramoeba flamelloides]|uniref:Electron carrier/ protein disulfide oxidoreductase n=1 Tax=Anaeramoeba flamelloides TaxID=1746091 RepID=A0AAV7Y8I6_9EUKA|nr:electron carrier/ protein disulfide oxidoreductase [Anaeramoeba flamelloides]